MKDIDEFVKYLNIEKNYSIKTIESYKLDLEEIYSYFKKSFSKITEQDILNYLEYLDGLKMKKSTISRKISTLKSFYKYFCKNNLIINPTEYILFPKRDKKLPNYIEYNELEDIIKSSLNTKTKGRDNLIIELLYATGIRVSELVNIKLNDIDYSNKSISVVGKGNKERIVYFGEYAEDALNNYIDIERNITLNGKESIWLFPNKNGINLTTRSIELIIDKIMKNTLIKTKISPHTLRHTFATHMLNNGCDIKVVQELLGHESLNTTEIYTHISNEELRNVYLKCHIRK